MIHSDIRLIALDLDGTLLDDEKKISSQAVKMIKEVMRQGVIVTLASARPVCAMLPYAHQLGLTAPLVTLSGAYVTDTKQAKTWLRKSLDFIKYREMISIFEEEDYYIKVYFENQLFVQQATRETINYSRAFWVPYTEVGSKGLRDLNEPPLRVVLFDDPVKIQRAAKILAEWTGYFSIFPDTERGLEIVEHTVSKGAALKVVCEHLGIPLSNVMAIGNEGSDVSMVSEVGLGIAMGNACEQLRQCAVAVTKTNNEGGVEDAIRRYVLK